MSLTHLEDDYDHFYNPRFEVRLGNRTVREAEGVISGLTVETGLDRTNRVSFTLNEPYDHEQGNFPGFADQPVEKGVPVAVRMGYGDTLRHLFSGRVESVQPNFPAEGGPTVEVSGNDPSQAMTNGKRSRSWDGATLTTVVTDVASEYDFAGVAVELPQSVDLRFPKLVQHEQTDYDFLTDELADAYGFECFVREGVFHVRDPDPLAAPILELTYGESLRSFRPSGEDAEVRVGTVEVRDWDPGTKSAITATASVPGGGQERDERRAPVDSRREAELIAESIAFDLAPGIRGRAETIGLPEIREGRVVALGGLGGPFPGPYYVERTTHRMDRSGYTTSFEARKANVFEGFSRL